MNASLLKQNPKRFKRTQFMTKHYMRIFGVSPCFEATQQHLNTRSTVKKKMRWYVYDTYLLVELFCCFGVQSFFVVETFCV